MLKLFANENIPKKSIEALRKLGNEVFSASEEMPGAEDSHVLQRAAAASCILITFDRDYGELIYRRGLPTPAAVIYLRFLPKDALEPATKIQQLLDQVDCAGYFTVLDVDAIRRRPLPKPKP